MKPDGAASLLSLCTGTVKCIPKDGSCLYTAALVELKRLLCDPTMPYALLAHHTAYGLRQQCAAWVSLHSDDTYEGLSLADWIRHETNENVAQYVERMGLANEWGGVVELFAISRLFGVSVWVYEPVTRERAPLSAGTVRYMRRTHVFDGAAASATTSSAASQQAASGAVCLLYNGVNHYDVFAPAVGATLQAIASLLGAEAVSGARGAEAIRHSQQLLRCSDDLDLSSFGRRGPPGMPPSPTHLRGGGGGGGGSGAAGGIGGGFGSAFGPEQHALLVAHEKQEKLQQPQQQRGAATAAAVQSSPWRATRRGMTSEDEPCADGHCYDHPLLHAGSPLVSPRGSARGALSSPEPSPRVVPPRPLVRDQRRLPRTAAATTSAKAAGRFLVRPWRWQRRRRQQPAPCEPCCKEVKV